MNFFARQFATIFAPILIGVVANLLTEGIDRLKTLTATWGAAQKQALAALIASVAAAGGAAAGHVFLAPGTPVADALSNLDVNAIAGALFAFAIKHGQQIKKGAS